MPTCQSQGQRVVGRFTVTVKEQLALPPQALVTVHVTTVVPRGEKAAGGRGANDGPIEAGRFDFEHAHRIGATSHDHLVRRTSNGRIAARGISLHGHITDVTVGLTLTNVNDRNVSSGR